MPAVALNVKYALTTFASLNTTTQNEHTKNHFFRPNFGFR